MRSHDTRMRGKPAGRGHGGSNRAGVGALRLVRATAALTILFGSAQAFAAEREKEPAPAARTAAVDQTGGDGAKLQPPIDPEAAKDLSVFVSRNRAGEDNGLHSEFIVNGTTADVFTSDKQRQIGKHIRPEWNTIAVKTTRQENATSPNGLGFSIGPVRHDDAANRDVMKPVLWSFGNQRGWDWEKEGGYSYRLDPAATESAQTYHLFFAGLDLEDTPIREGDYILTGGPKRSGEDVPYTGTIYVNGTPLNSFAVQPRRVVITSLLKQGKNEIRLVTRKVEGAVLSDSNGLSFTVQGPAVYDARNKQFMVAPVTQLDGNPGWAFDPKTGAAVSKAKPGYDTVERAVPLFLDEAPRTATAVPAAAAALPEN